MQHIVTVHHKALCVYMKSFESEGDALTTAESLAKGCGVVNRTGNTWECENNATVKVETGLS